MGYNFSQVMAVIAFALGIGVTTTVFNIFYSVLLKPLPYPDAVARAWASALVLIVLVAILFTAARLIGRNRVGAKK